jgi:hypothetical protein
VATVPGAGLPHQPTEESMSRKTRRRTARHLRPRPPLPLVAVLAAALLLPAVAADGQYFGRNKVLWEDFPFHTSRTEHFDLYYYPADHAAADELARMAERWHERLTIAMDHRLADRKPLIFYADQPDFRQTTVTRGLVGEGVGGFTEPLRNRVVLPLAGSLAETDHVLGHELVHAFQFDLANQLAALGRNASLSQIPLWMVEGMAEYYSKGRVDPLTAMWLRDAVADDRLPNLNQLNRGGEYNPYRYGQAFYAYVAGRWDDRTVTRLFGTALLTGPRRAIEEVLGESPDDVFADWHQAVRDAYQPILAARQEADERADLVIGEDTLAGRLNVAPALSPDGRRLAFLSTRNLFTLDLYVADAATGEVERRLVSGRGNPHFDALRFIDSAGAWSPDGRRFAVTVFAEGDNQLAVIDADSGRVVERYAPPVGSMSNPAWAPDGRTLAFSGSIDGITDLWLLDVQSGEARRLTDDAYTDVQPAFSPDGRTIAFATDRGPGTDLGQLDFSPLKIGLYDLETGRTQVLDLFAGARHIDPQFSPDGRYLYFLADPDGISDVYRLEVAGGRVARLTELKTGASGITYESPALSVASQSGDVVFSVYRDSRYSIFRLPPEPVSAAVDPQAPLDRDAALLPPLPGQLGQPGADTVSLYLNRPEAGLPADVELESRPYESRLGLAYVGPPSIGVGVDRYGFGVGGSVAAYFTDVLNRHQVGVAIQGGNAGGGVGTTIGGQVSYLNQTDRLAWGADATHLPYVTARTAVGQTLVDVGGGELVPADVVRQVREITTIDELSAVAHYPLSASRRFEVSGGTTWYSFDREIEEIVLINGQVVDRNEGDLAAPEDLELYRGAAAFVGDSSIYGFASPVAGTRYRLQVETYGGDLSFQTALADYRRYFLHRPVTLAVRGIHYGRYGDDAETDRISPLYVGTETWVRGYAVGDFDLDECTPVADSTACPEFDRLVGSRVGLVNVELRVPLFGIEGYGLFEVPWAPTELVLFADAGAAWTEDETPDLRFDEDTVDRVPVVSAGVAARIVLGGYLPVELYYAHPFQRPETDWQFGLVIAPGW